MASFKEIRDDVIKLADAGAQVEDINEFLMGNGYTPDEFRRASENFGTFTSSVKRGGKGIASLVGDIVPAMGGYVGEKLGIAGAKEYKERQMAEAAQTQEEISKFLPAKYESYTDVTNPLEALGYAKEAVGEAIPSMLPSVVTGGTAGVLGRGAVAAAGKVASEQASKAYLASQAAKNVSKDFAAKRAAEVGATAATQAMARKQLGQEALGAFTGSAALNIPEAYQSIYSETGQEQLLPALASGSFNAVLDAITPLSLLRSAKGKGLTNDAIVGAWYARGAKELGKGFLTEGATESLQEMTNAAAVKFVDENKDFFTPENLTRFIDAGLKGGIGGGAIQGGFGVAFGKQAPKAAPPVPPTTPPGVSTSQPTLPEGAVQGHQGELFGAAPEGRLPDRVEPIFKAGEVGQTETPEGTITQTGKIQGYQAAAPLPPEVELTGKQESLLPESEQGELDLKAPPEVEIKRGELRNIYGQPIDPLRNIEGDIAGPLAGPAKPIGEEIRSVVETAKQDPSASKLLKANNPATAKIVSSRVQELIDSGLSETEALEQLYQTDKSGAYPAGTKALSEAQRELLETAYRRMTGRDIEAAIKDRAFMGAQQGDLFEGPDSVTKGKTEEAPVTTTPEEAWGKHKNDDHPDFSTLPPELQARWASLVNNNRGNAVNFQDIIEAYLATTNKVDLTNKTDEDTLAKYDKDLRTDITSSVTKQRFKNVINYLMTHGPEANQALMKQVYKRYEDMVKNGYKFAFSVVNQRGASWAGLMDPYKVPGTMHIKLNSAHNGVTIRTASHESIHGVSYALIDYGKKNPNTPEGKIVKQLVDLQKHVVNFLMEKRRNDPSSLTAFENQILNSREASYGRQADNALGLRTRHGMLFHEVDEMMTWGLTDGRMLSALDNIPYKNTTVAQRFVDLIRSLLGISEKHDTAFNELLRLTHELLEMPTQRTGVIPLASKAAVQTSWSERDTPDPFGREEALTRLYKKMQGAYDESFSPDEAFDAAYEQATKEEQYILRQLKKDGMLGFDYPHQAIQAIIEEPTAYDLSPQLKTAISRLGNKLFKESADSTGALSLDAQYDSQVANTLVPAPAPGPSVVPAPGQPYTLGPITKLQSAPNAGQQVKNVAQKVTNAWNDDGFWTRFRIAAVDPTASLAKTLSSLPLFQNGQLRADMLVRAFNQVINLIKNGLQSGIPVINSDGTVIIEQSENNLARSQILADELDSNPIVKGSGFSGRGFVAEIARIKRGEEIMAEDARLRAKGALMMADAKAKMAQARQLRASSAPMGDIIKLINQAKALRREGSKIKDINREKQVNQARIDWADAQLKAVPEVNGVLDIWRAVNTSLIDLWESTGLLTKAEADNYRQKKFYVPLYAAREDLALDQQEAYTGKGTGTKSVGRLDRLEGSDKQRNIWENMDKHYASMLASAFQNQTRKIAVDQLQSLGAAKIAKNSDDPNINLRYKDPSNPNADANGVVHAIVDNPNDLAAFQMMHYELNPIMKGFSATTQALRATALINPMYWIKQLIRDPIHASLVAGTGIVTPWHSAKEYINVLANNSEEALLLARRGVIGQVDSTIDLADFLKQVGTEKINPSKLDKMIHAVMKAHEASDAATRVAIYKKAKAEGLAKGMSEKEATDYGVFKSRESINFAVRGNSKTLNALRHMIPFFSAAIVGLDTMYRAATGYGLNPAEKKAAQQLFIKRAAMMSLMTTAYAMMLQDDEDYKKLPDNVKDNNWLLPNPFGEGHSFIKIAVPYEVGFLFKTVPEAAVRYLAGNATGKELLASYASGLQRNLPGEGILIPQAAKPALEAVTNYSFFTKRPIEGMSDQGLPVASRGPNASEVAKIASKYGLDKIGISPAKFDHLMQGYLAEMGTFTTGAASAAINAATGKEPPTKNIEQMPFFKSFMTNPNTSKAATDFYDIMGNAQETVNAFNRMKKEGRVEEAKEFMADEDKRKLMAIAPTMRKVQDNMAKIRARINQIEASKGMDPETKRQQINKLMAMYDKVAQQGYQITQRAGIER